MAYENFKETIWAKGIERALKLRTVLEDGCNKQYKGEVGEGKRVKIVGVSRPTISTYTPGTDIGAPEKPADTGVYLDIDQYKYANFFVDSVEDAQTDADIMQALIDGAADGIAEIRDTYVGSLAALSEQSSVSTAIGNSDAAIGAIDTALVELWSNGVKQSNEIRIECPPWFYDLITNKIISLSTDNPKIIGNGEVGMYKGAHVFMANCLHNDNTDDYIMVRTRKAIAFAGGIHRVIPYEPEKQFGDAIKVLDTYGAKIVRPEELFVIKAHRT